MAENTVRTRLLRDSDQASIIAEKSTVAQVPLPKFSKNCIVTQDYRAATYELMKEV